MERMLSVGISKGSLVEQPEHAPHRAVVEGGDGVRHVTLEGSSGDRSQFLRGKLFVWPDKHYVSWVPQSLWRVEGAVFEPLLLSVSR